MEEEYGWDYYLGMLVVILLFASFYWFVVDSPEQREGRNQLNKYEIGASVNQVRLKLCDPR